MADNNKTTALRNGGRYFYYLQPFWLFLEGNTFIISGHLGLLWRALFLLFSAILALFEERFFHCSLAILARRQPKWPEIIEIPPSEGG